MLKFLFLTNIYNPHTKLKDYFNKIIYIHKVKLNTQYISHQMKTEIIMIILQNLQTFSTLYSCARQKMLITVINETCGNYSHSAAQTAASHYDNHTQINSAIN